MKLLLLLTLFLGTAMAKEENNNPIAIVIHGGAGTIQKGHLSEEMESNIKAALQQALDVGYEALADGQDAEAAVVAAIQILEDAPYFNAGKGAVFTKPGKHELDASIMRGDDLNAGAVAGVSYTKNPILAAQQVMHHSPHVMLQGVGADEFSKIRELTQVKNDYFDTEFRRDAWKEVDAKTKAKQADTASADDILAAEFKYGTVGAVALDKQGNIVAGTSTGGMTYKAWGRVGDSPIIGAGTYADNRSCGISATGHGEYFIRYTVASDICARVRYKNIGIEQAADEVIMKELKQAGGDGGVIGLDPKGNVIMTFNTAGMYRGYKKAEGSDVLIYGGE